MNSDTDPILERRRRMARWAAAGRRAGYSLYAVSLTALAVGQLSGLSSAVASAAAGALVAGSVVLAPSIIIGYGVRAANRADRDDDW